MSPQRIADQWFTRRLYYLSLPLTMILIAFGSGCAGVSAGQAGGTTGGSGHNGGTQSVSLTIAPDTASVDAGQPAQFTATVLGTTNTSVTWSLANLSGQSSPGTISSSGLYLAPPLAPGNSPVKVAVTATSVADNTKDAEAVVTVQPAISISVAPDTATVDAGQPAQFTATVLGTSNTGVTWTLANLSGQGSPGTISSAGLYTAPSLAPGAAQIEVTVTATSVADHTKDAVATVTVRPPTLAPGVSPRFFGMHINRSTSPWPTVSFGSYRSLNSSATKWADINTAEQTYSWTSLDRWLAKAQGGGQEVLYTLYGTPSWASSRGVNSGNPDYSCAYQENGPGVCDAPDDLNADGTGTDQHWKDFITALLKHVGPGKIQYWEVWNEPNVPGTWQGTQAQLLRLAQDAYTIVKTADSGALLVTPPMVSGWYPGQMQWLQSYLQAGGAQWADVIAIHGYVQKQGDVCPASCPEPEDVAKVLDGTRAVMAATGQQDKPVFDTEGSWGAGVQMTDSDQQIMFMARFYAIQIAGTTASKGFDRFYWYGWDLPGTGQFYDPTTKQVMPSGLAYQQFYTWTVGATASSCTPSGTQWTCGLARSPGYEAEMIWDTSQGCTNGVCSTTNIAVDSKYVQFRDLAGNTTAISNGTAPVGGKPILLETGNPPK